MKSFSELIEQLDQTNKTNDKINALVTYFSISDEEDIVHTIALFTGRRPKRIFSTKEVRTIGIELSALPEWLFEESYQVVGDLAETISMLIQVEKETFDKKLSTIISELKELRKATEDEKYFWLKSALLCSSKTQRFILLKLLTGGFRIGVSQNLIIKALSKFSGIDENLITHRLMGDWDADTLKLEEILRIDSIQSDDSKPYPFCLARSFEENIDAIEIENNFFAEWKYDGIRAQIIKRKDVFYIWSRGEELLSDKFPELNDFINTLPNGIVLDGEIVVYKSGNIQSFNHLQTRISRKNITKKTLEENPVLFIAYDCLEYDYEDIRSSTLFNRRQILVSLFEQHKFPNATLSEIISFKNFEELKVIRATSRNNSAEGLMLKHKSSEYHVGRKSGDWYKWKIDPLSIDAVLIYAQRGHGRRADLYTDYTFAIWNNGELLSFAKAYSGLNNEEIKELDKFIKANTKEKFGPVRTVEPVMVFEIGFEGIAESKRHKSGIALRFPRILRWRKDKKAEEADTLENLKQLLNVYNANG